MITQSYRKIFLALLVVAGHQVVTAQSPGSSGWQSLFNGKDLTGWTVKSKPADAGKTFWKVEDGVIVADSMHSQEHDYVWLVSEGEYDDFVLRLRFRSFRDSPGNSGVQIRSRYDDEAGWLDGPQVDIHPPGPWRTGMIWDETRGNQRWLYPGVPKGKWVDPSMAAPGLKYYHSDDTPGWNDLEIIAQGNKLSARLNGVTVMQYDGSGVLDDAIHQQRRVGQKGHVALQIHSRDRLKIGFKDIRIRPINHSTPLSDWRLIWSDEFSTPGLPDRSKWGYETGFIRNRESQFYTSERLENARVENGMLIIEGRKEKWPNPHYNPRVDAARNWRASAPFAEYTAASLITEGKASFLYGRIEVRAKLPQGKGVWPAIWMMGTNRPAIGWPRCGEIDIMEFVGKEPNTIHANVHFSKDGRHTSQGGKIKATAPYDGFHIYALEWFPDRMDFYFDEHKYFTFDLDLAGAGPDNPFRKPHYLLINFALGGSWGGPIDDTVLPQKYLIDYVRVYEAVDH
jgi:beta-glucanase (GH16 family)